MGRKGREAIMLEPVPLEGNTEEEGGGLHRQRSSLGHEGSNYILNTPTLGTSAGKSGSLNWLENKWK